MNTTPEIAAWRTEIDRLDDDLLRLLNRRAQLASRVLGVKRSNSLPVCDPRRELEVLARIRDGNPGPLDARAVEAIFRQVIYETRRSEEYEDARRRHPHSAAPLDSGRVAFQGEPGAFSEDAIRRLFSPRAESLPCVDFDALFAAVTRGQADFAVVPLENTLAGGVAQCHDLLLENDLHIVAETVVRIAHYLIACPGSTLEGLRTVQSHPVALAQCRRFLAAHPAIHPVAADDTAGSVRSVMQQGDLTCAAIAGAGAARTYGAHILAEHLEDHPENYTRFVLLAPRAGRDALPAPDANKTSLVLGLSRRTGVLHQALSAFAARGIDLVSIEPRPVKGRPWEYRFFLDLAASAAHPQMQAALEELERTGAVQELRLLGSYRAAGDPDRQIDSAKEIAKQ